jgi:polyhydroxybutyrate depolymerase
MGGAGRAYAYAMRRFVLFIFVASTITAACGTSASSREDSKGSNVPGDAPGPASAPGGDAKGPAAPGAASVPPQPASQPPAPKPKPIVTNETVQTFNESRTFVLATPGTYDPTKTYPLVLVLHGDGGDGPSMRAAVPFDDVAGDEAFVAYPSGRQGGWNLYDPVETNADDAFLLAIVDTVRARANIDPRRVFGIGFSSGAFMVSQVACRKPGFFRGIVPHSGGAPSEPRDSLASHWPNSYTRCRDQTLGSGPATLVIHGTADGTVTFDSGDFTATYWAYVNGCETARSASNPSPCLTHEGCPTDQPVRLCPIPSLGHAIWANTGQTAWGFFQKL